MTLVPFAPEAVLPLLSAALRDFNDKHGFTDAMTGNELNQIARRLGIGRSPLFERTRVNKLKNWKPDQGNMILSNDEWVVLLHVLPGFRNQLRERVLTWVAPFRPQPPPEDEVIQQQLFSKFGVEAIVPANDSQVDLYELAGRHFLNRLMLVAGDPGDENIPTPVVAISGGRTQDRLADAIESLCVQVEYNRHSVAPSIVALNDFNDPTRPTLNAATIIARLAFQLGGQPLAPPRGDTRKMADGLYLSQLDSPYLVLLGAGNVETSFLKQHAEQKATRINPAAKGDLGGLCLDDNGHHVPDDGLLDTFRQELDLRRLRRWCGTPETVMAVVPQPKKGRIVEIALRNRYVNRIFMGRELALEVLKLGEHRPPLAPP